MGNVANRVAGNVAGQSLLKRPLFSIFLASVLALSLWAAPLAAFAQQPTAAAAEAAEPGVPGGLATVSASSTRAVATASAASELTQYTLADEYALYLAHKYDLVLEDGLTRGAFFDALAWLLDLPAAQEEVVFSDLAVGEDGYDAAAALYEAGLLSGPGAQVDAELTPLAAVWLTVRAAELQELAATYPQAKVDAALAAARLPGNIRALPLPLGQELAAAIDSGLLPEAYANAQTLNQRTVSAELANVLLGQLLVHTNAYKQYLGNLSDPGIAAKVAQAFETSNILQSEALQAIVDTALEQDDITGYNLKDLRYEAGFVDALTITYGHANIKHATQLIGLLRSEGVDAKVQLEPKTSAFIYLEEWGTPSESSSFQVSQIANGNYIAFAKEYDLKLEFYSSADRDRFNSIILAYAKRNSDDMTGLLHGSWWQPLYYSSEPLAGYVEITNNAVVSGHLYAQSFSLNENAAQVQASFAAIDPEVEVISYTFWTNEAFHNYLTGGYN